MVCVKNVWRRPILCVRVHVIISLRQFLPSLRSQSLQSCLTLCDAMYCNLPGSYVREILQARMLEWVATSSLRGSSWPRDWTYISCVSCIAGDYLSLSMEITVQLSHSAMSDSLWPHGLQQARTPFPSPTPRACSNSCLSSWWCHPPSYPLLSPSPPAFNLSQHQGFF